MFSPYNPPLDSACATSNGVWALPFSLAATGGMVVRLKAGPLFYFPPGTEMFHFPGFALPTLMFGSL